MSRVYLKRGFFVVIFFYVLLLGLLNIQLDHHNFEGGLYKFRYHSIIKDHDFNLINNNQDKFNDILTPTDNIADMHDIGAPIIWSFFYDWYHTFFPELKPLKLRENAYILDEELITSTFHLIILIFIFAILFKQGLLSKEKWPLPFLLAASLGVHDYIYDQFFTADILALFIMGLLVVHTSKLDVEEKKDIYSLSILFGLLRIIKISSILYTPAILFFLFIKKKDLKNFISNLLRFSLVYSLFMALTEVNFYTTLGSWSFLQGYDYAYSIDYLFSLHGWKATYLYPRGLFLHTPILLFSLIPITLLIKDIILKRSIRDLDNKLLISALIYAFMLIKLSLGFFSITAHYLGLGARQFFIDFLPLCFIFEYLWKRSKKATLILLFGSSISLLFYTFSWYALDKEFELFALLPPLEASQWSEALEVFLGGLLSYLKRFSISLAIHLDLLLLISFLLFIMTFFYRFFSNKDSRLYSVSTIAIIIFSYSFMNLFNNEANTAAFIEKVGYDHYIQGKGGPLYLSHELLSGLSLAKEYERRYGTPASQKYLKELSASFKKDLLSDIGFIGIKFNKTTLRSDLLEGEKFPVDIIQINQNK